MQGHITDPLIRAGEVAGDFWQRLSKKFFTKFMDNISIGFFSSSANIRQGGTQFGVDACALLGGDAKILFPDACALFRCGLFFFAHMPTSISYNDYR
ncbi:MAG TPA: hypothetical protein VHZ51_28690 [Ktedonobacteraceae bacterium]|nr:hypothetical protein [Ktedonobacteraceae bacterium]